MRQKIKKKTPSRAVRLLRVLLIAAILCGLLGGIAVAAVNIAVTGGTKGRILSAEEAAALPEVDAILVLGCQVRGDGTPSPMLQDRIDCGVRLYQLGVSPVLLVSGDSRYEGYDEVGAMKRVSEEGGVPTEAIRCDGYGLSTYDSLYRAQKLLGYRKIVVVTQEYHLYRALYIAEQLGVEAYGVAADARSYRGQWQRELREAAARVKDMLFCMVSAEAEMGLSVWKPLP